MDFQGRTDLSSSPWVELAPIVIWQARPCPLSREEKNWDAHKLQDAFDSILSLSFIVLETWDCISRKTPQHCVSCAPIPKAETQRNWDEEHGFTTTAWPCACLNRYLRVFLHTHMHMWQKINSREERTLLWENILGAIRIFNSKIGSTIYNQPAKLEIPSQQKNIQGRLQRVSHLLLNKISVLVLLLSLLPKLKLSRSSGRGQKKKSK